MKIEIGELYLFKAVEYKMRLDILLNNQIVKVIEYGDKNGGLRDTYRIMSLDGKHVWTAMEGELRPIDET